MNTWLCSALCAWGWDGGQAAATGGSGVWSDGGCMFALLARGCTGVLWCSRSRRPAHWLGRASPFSCCAAHGADHRPWLHGLLPAWAAGEAGWEGQAVLDGACRDRQHRARPHACTSPLGFGCVRLLPTPLPPLNPSRKLPTFLSLFPLLVSSPAPATQNISVLTGETSSVSIQQIVQLGMFSIITYAV